MAERQNGDRVELFRGASGRFADGLRNLMSGVYASLDSMASIAEGLFSMAESTKLGREERARAMEAELDSISRDINAAGARSRAAQEKVAARTAELRRQFRQESKANGWDDIPSVAVKNTPPDMRGKQGTVAHERQ